MNSQLRSKVILLSLCLVLAISSFSYLAIDFYIKSTAIAVINSWLESEALNLQQGGYLSSVAKSQRILLSSAFINGLSLIKVEERGISQLIQIGKIANEKSWDCSKSRIETQITGLFSYRFLHCFESNPEIRISFFSENYIFKWVLLSSILIIFLFITFVIFILLYLHRREVLILETISNISRQVAHDIRSPLSALKIASARLQDSSGEARIIIDASKRIEEIAEDLLKKSRQILTSNQSDTSGEETWLHIKDVLEDITAEKFLRYPGKIILDISHDSISVKIKADKDKFYRAISNLVNNSLEAIDETPDGVVTLGLRKGANQSQIIIIDNGKGIPKEILPKVGIRGFTFGKKDGNGLGISSAKSFAEKIGGTLSINSTLGVGTVVTVTFKNTSE